MPCELQGGQPSAGDAVEFRTVPGSKGDAARDAVIQPSCFEPPEEFKVRSWRVLTWTTMAQCPACPSDGGGVW
eukprot:234158-Rhodomonas_salina.3